MESVLLCRGSSLGRVSPWSTLTAIEASISSVVIRSAIAVSRLELKYILVS